MTFPHEFRSRLICGQGIVSSKLRRHLVPSIAVLACMSTSAHATAEESRVIGGTPVKSCGFPSVVSLDRGGMGCTGTLVHPKVVFTAAHCFMMGGTARTVHFGERRGSRSRTAKVEKCVSHPNWNKTKEVGGTDIAYCVLAEEVKDVPITPILMGCETEVLKKDTPVVIAGYGLTRPPWSTQEQESDLFADGVKHWTETRYIETLETGELKAAIVGSKGKQGCKGDSGGPVFVKLPEDKYGKNAGWRVFGVTSGQRSDTDPECTTGTGTYAIMHEWIETVEKETGIDLTPCFDADGTWNPGPDCHSAPRELDTTAAGSWPGSCESGPLTGKITSCGEQGDSDPGGDDSPKDSPKESPKKPDPSQGDPDPGGSTPKTGDSEKPGASKESPDGGGSGQSPKASPGTESPESKPSGEETGTGAQGSNGGNGDEPAKDSGCSLTEPAGSTSLALLALAGLGLRRRLGR